METRGESQDVPGRSQLEKDSFAVALLTCTFTSILIDPPPPPVWGIACCKRMRRGSALGAGEPRGCPRTFDRSHHLGRLVREHSVLVIKTSL